MTVQLKADLELVGMVMRNNYSSDQFVIDACDKAFARIEKFIQSKPLTTVEIEKLKSEAWLYAVHQVEGSVNTKHAAIMHAVVDYLMESGHLK